MGYCKHSVLAIHQIAVGLLHADVQPQSADEERSTIAPPFCHLTT